MIPSPRTNGAGDEMIRLDGVHKAYVDGADTRVNALEDVSLSICRGEYVAIVGPSGSGKSTLLYILGMLLSPTSGEYRFSGEDVAALSDERLSAVRNRRIGFVFQSFHLVPQLSTMENVELPLVYKGADAPAAEERHARCQALLERVEMEHRLTHRPGQLSNGEMQRVAIARALANDPELVLADEPTGNLDGKTGGEIARLLKELNAEGRTLIVVTHNPELSGQAQRVLTMADGRLV